MHRLAVFASGSGTNFEAIVQACEQGVLNARVVLMVCDKPGARVVERAAAHGVETFVFSPKAYGSKADFEREIVALLDAAGVEFRGARAIEQAFAYGVKVFGVTIHRVDATLDSGPIVAQRAFEYYGRDLAELEAMVHATEYPLYVETIGKILNDK